MPWTRVLLGVALGAVLVASVAMPASAAPPMVKQINKARHANGVPGLRYSPSLSRSSARFARHLMRVDRFGHSARIWGSSAFSRLGENLALSRGWRLSRSRVVRLWLRSPGHRAVMLGRGFNRVGVGRARGRFGRRPATIVVAQFGRR